MNSTTNAQQQFVITESGVEGSETITVSSLSVAKCVATLDSVYTNSVLTIRDTDNRLLAVNDRRFANTSGWHNCYQ